MPRILSIVLLMLLQCRSHAQDVKLRQEALEGLRKATEYYRRHVATEGGYLWRYSEDLSKREGEGNASKSQVWIQPPGTPTVGLAYLKAYQATGDNLYLDAARDVAKALVRGQLRSGGWDYSIEFDPAKRSKFAYRSDPHNEQGKNVSTLDDNNTQEAVRFLLHFDHATKGMDAQIRETLGYALESLLNVQFPNGAWPQRFWEKPDAAKHPVKKASYPPSWSKSYPAQDYRNFYTFNDNSISDVIDVMLLATALTGDVKYRKAAERAGDFMILAQMPEPQPGWAQQYDLDMHPAWARKFEPPSITGGEAQGVMLSLLRLYRETGQKKFLEPLPKALAYYKKSLLPDGRLARFYELKTNKPLYVNKKYEITYDDSDLITHYGLRVGSKLDQIAKEFERVRTLDPAQLKPKASIKKPEISDALRAKAKDALNSLDAQGRWLEDGPLRYQGAGDATKRILSTQTFVRRLQDLSAFLAATKP
jgi:hypothetical protein